MPHAQSRLRTIIVAWSRMSQDGAELEVKATLWTRAGNADDARAAQRHLTDVLVNDLSVLIARVYDYPVMGRNRLANACLRILKDRTGRARVP